MRFRPILFFSLLVGLNSVFTQAQSDLLGSVGWCNEIELYQTNEKCGEWGGDTEFIRVYQKDCEGPILVDYIKTIIDCSDPYALNAKPKTIKKKEIKLSTEQKKMIEGSILELVEHKISAKKYIGHSGLANSVIYKDSTLIINDFPSVKWPTFNALTKSISEK